MAEHWLTFTSERFDHTSNLPREANAGNRFYGRDVAQFIVDGLSALGHESSFIDEDWGWLVRATISNVERIQICIYYDLEGSGVTTRPGRWTLRMEDRRGWRRRSSSDGHRELMRSIFSAADISLQDLDA